MLAIAAVGLIVNIIAARRASWGSSSDSMNARGAYLHVLGRPCSRASETLVAAILIRLYGLVDGGPARVDSDDGSDNERCLAAGPRVGGHPARIDAVAHFRFRPCGLQLEAIPGYRIGARSPRPGR